nr:MAG TPA: hypothetical protein [Caudoviricetes sp.]
MRERSHLPCKMIRGISVQISSQQKINKNGKN